MFAREKKPLESLLAAIPRLLNIVGSVKVETIVSGKFHAEEMTRETADAWKDEIDPKTTHGKARALFTCWYTQARLASTSTF